MAEVRVLVNSENRSYFCIPLLNIFLNGTESARLLDLKIWDLIPDK